MQTLLLTMFLNFPDFNKCPWLTVDIQEPVYLQTAGGDMILIFLEFI